MESAEEISLLDAFERDPEEATFLRLYRAHTPMIFAMALRLSSSRSDAEELVQEAWVRAVERLPGFERRSSLRTWLCGILVNCYREQSRRQARAPRSLDDEGSERDRGTATELSSGRTAVARRATSIDVERAVQRLPRGYREIVVLHDVHGYTHREIAELLDIREGTSKSQLARGRERLRELLQNQSGRDKKREQP